MKDRLRDYGEEIRYSGAAFPLGDLWVDIECGYSEGGDWLRFMVIRAWPRASAAEGLRSDPRYDGFSGDRPKVRHADGAMRPVGMDGHVYLFIGDELRTMRADMNEYDDTSGLPEAGSLEGMWEYLQQFRVAGTD